MPWFLVDDQFHSDPRVLKLLATEPAALGLWAVAGAWSSAHLTDGYVPDDVLPQLFPDAVRLAEALVSAKILRRVKGAHKIIQNDGLCRIQSRQAVENDRKLATERKRRQRARHADVTPMSHAAATQKEAVENSGKHRKPTSDDIPSRRDSRVTPTVSHGVTLVHTDTEGIPLTPAADAAGEPGGACGHHQRTLGHPAANCRACGTNPRGRPEPPPPSPAERHPSARPVTEATFDAGLKPGHRPADDQTVATIAAQARQALNGGGGG